MARSRGLLRHAAAGAHEHPPASALRLLRTAAYAAQADTAGW